MSRFQVVIIPSQNDMRVEFVESDHMSNTVFTKWVETYIQGCYEDSHDEEEMGEILSEIWNSQEVNNGVHMIRTEAETIVMTQI
jgi:uncharacterized membrane-anchored protein YjiN (DUF445 family)